VQDGDPLALGRQAVRELARAVRRVVVDHEHAPALRQHLAECDHHPLEVLALVVGRQADDGPGHPPIIATWPTYRGMPTSRTRSTCSRTCSSWKGRTRFASSRTAA